MFNFTIGDLVVDHVSVGNASNQERIQNLLEEAKLLLHTERKKSHWFVSIVSIICLTELCALTYLLYPKLREWNVTTTSPEEVTMQNLRCMKHQESSGQPEIAPVTVTPSRQAHRGVLKHV